MPSSGQGRVPWRSRIGLKLVATSLALAVAMLAFLLVWVGPRTTRAFVARGDALVTQTAALMRTLAAEHTQSTREVLVDVVDHTTKDRESTLEDLPVSIYGDVERMRKAIAELDRERSSRIRGNAQVLAREAQRRADARIDAHLEQTSLEEHHVTEELAADLRGSYLWMCGVALGALVLVLGLGMYVQVVLPVAQLRAATRRVAEGDLEVSVSSGSRDEVGALAADFSTMVGQLRESRAALTTLNQGLEREVQRKTQELVQAQKLASIGTLAGGIAHEFNNLIGGIRGCVQELARDAGPESQPTYGVIVRATERASAIVQQLLRFSKRTAIRPERCDVTRLLEDASGLIAPEARRRGVEVSRDLPAELPLTADADGLHQVFLNLMTNALQAMPNGGKLAISARRAGGEVSIRIRDTGVGIAKEDQDRIFEPFFTRKDREADPTQRGIGLGLSVSFGIVEAHHGRIGVESAPGEGTTFTVVLPG